MISLIAYLRGTSRTIAVSSLIVLLAILSTQLGKGANKTEGPPTSSTKIAENSDETLPAEIWIRPVKVEVAEDSPLRSNKDFNDPPKMYVLCKKNGKTGRTGPVHAAEWNAEFPDDDAHGLVLGTSAKDEYTVEVWDSQRWKDKLLFAIGPFTGEEWRKKLSDTASKELERDKPIVFSTEGATISLAYTAMRVWYRLVNVTIPPASPHQKDDKINHPPRLQVYLKVNGEYYGSKSTRHVGWSADFAKVAENCWAVREGPKRRYTVEVWDNQKTGWQQIFSVSGLTAEQFRDVIREEVGPLVDKDRAATVTFERIEKPF